MSIEDRLVEIANALEELTKAIETGRVQIKDVQDHITTIEECDISEWNTPAKIQFKKILNRKRQKAREDFENICKEEKEAEKKKRRAREKILKM